jgi:hypothetical protein
MILAIGIWATGFFVFTMLLRVAIPIMNGDFHVADDGVGFHIGDNMFFLSKADRELRAREAEENLATESVESTEQT